MAKRLKYFPYTEYVKDRPAQHKKCPECGFGHTGNEALCDVCSRGKIAVVRCQQKPGEPHE